MDFIGEWRLRNGMRAEVKVQEGLRFYGTIHYEKEKKYDIPAAWDEHGNCTSCGNEFDLVERKLPGEGL